MKKSLLALALAGALSQVQAADDLGTIVVSAARTPQSELSTPASITVITREQILAKGADNLSEVLRNVAGVVVDDLFGDGTRTSVSMRGFGENAGKNTLLLVDGRRIDDITLANPQLVRIPIEAIERIEIVKGSAGTLFGDRAVGGVINVITRVPAGRSLQAEAGLGSFGRVRARGQFANAHENGLEYRVTAEARNGDGYREHNRLQQRSMTGYFGFAHDRGRIFLDGQLLTEYLQTPGALSLGEIGDNPRQSLPSYANDFTDRLDRSLRVGLEQDLGANLSLLAEWGYRRENKTFRISSRVGTPDALDDHGLLREKEFTPRLVYARRLKTGLLQATLGYDWLKGSNETVYNYIFLGTPGSYASTANQEKKSWYLQATVPLSRSLALTAGGRKARSDNDSSTTVYDPQRVNVWTLGMDWSVSDSLSLSLRRDGNFRFAAVDELSYIVPGQQLQPQKGVSWEMGVNWKYGRVVTDLSVYRLDLDNEIVYDPFVLNPASWTGQGANVNLDPTRREGLILDVAHRFEKDRIDVSYAFVRARFREGTYAGNTVGGVPRHTARLDWTHQWQQGWNTLLETVYTGRQYLQGDYYNTEGELGGYTVWNGRVAWSQGGVTLSARINNLFDKRYVQSAGYSSSAVLHYAYPAPERNFWLSAEWRI